MVLTVTLNKVSEVISRRLIVIFFYVVKLVCGEFFSVINSGFFSRL